MILICVEKPIWMYVQYFCQISKKICFWGPKAEPKFIPFMVMFQIVNVIELQQVC